MSDTNVPLNLEEHRELALELRATNARMHALHQMMISIYGPQNQAAFMFEKAADTLDRLCRDMQAQAAQDCPGTSIEKLYE